VTMRGPALTPTPLILAVTAHSPDSKRHEYDGSQAYPGNALICAQQPMPVRDLRVLFNDSLGADTIKTLLEELQQEWAAAASSWSAGTTSCSRPIRQAVAASKISAVANQRRAWRAPMAAIT